MPPYIAQQALDVPPGTFVVMTNMPPDGQHIAVRCQEEDEAMFRLVRYPCRIPKLSDGSFPEARIMPDSTVYVVPTEEITLLLEFDRCRELARFASTDITCMTPAGLTVTFNQEGKVTEVLLPHGW